jgi:hypothetical protein
MRPGLGNNREAHRAQERQGDATTYAHLFQRDDSRAAAAINAALGANPVPKSG